MKKFFSLTLTLAAMLSVMAVNAQAADYSFETDGTPEYYPSSSYEDVYGSRYNYGGKNVVDYQIPELEYGQFSTTQTGVMEKIMLPGLQGVAASGSGIYGISSGGGTVEIPGFLQGGSTATPAKDLDVGDKITYTTSMGTRTYRVETVTKISSSDWSYLSSTTDNRITLFTCVAGDPSHRWCVQAVQAS